MDTAKIFWTGRSQAIRLPKAFRFNASEVRIRRQGNSVLLELIATDWQWLDALIGPVDADFETAVLSRDAPQAGPELDTLFK